MRKAPSARLWSRFASSWKRLFSEPAATRQSRPRKISIQFDALEDRAIPAIGLFNTGVGGSVIQPPTPYATGVDTSGQSLSYLSSDSHYSISNAPTGYAGAVKVLTSAGAFPVGPWVGDNSTSAWLIPAAADDDGNAAPGDYDYTTTFQVTDPSTAFLSGQWAADDHASIFLNGNDTGISITGFQNFANFQIASGFVTGTNTLTFKVQNGGSSDNPTGLRVQFATPSIAADPHYTLISAPSGYTGSVTKVMPNDAYPIGPWIANNSTSAWISPASTDSQANAPVGDYVYRTTFSLDSFDTNTVLRGIWSADNQGVDILLNGVSTGISHFGNSTPSGIVGYTWTSPFTLTQGFVTGLNTLDFVIRNDALATNDPTFNPTGLRVDGLTIGIADQVSNVGDTVSLSVAASFNAGTTSFLASGLPSGLTIDTNTGVISGTIPVALSNGGYFNVTISASGSASQSFHWTVDSYPAYVAVVNQANTLYASTVQTAVAARNAAQVAAQQNANSAAQGIYDTYLTALDAAKSQLAAALDSALAAYQSALQGPDATLQAAVASATATSNSAMTAAQATYDSAIVAAEGIRQTALTDADNAYTQAVAPYQVAYDDAYQAYLSNPSDIGLQEALAQAQADLDLAESDAEAIRLASVASANSQFASSAANAQAAADATEEATESAYQASMSGPQAAFAAAQTAAQSTWDAAYESAKTAFDAGEALLWATYTTALVQINTSLAANFTAIEAQLQADLSDALADWHVAEAAAWTSYSDARDESPVQLPLGQRVPAPPLPNINGGQQPQPLPPRNRFGELTALGGVLAANGGSLARPIQLQHVDEPWNPRRLFPNFRQNLQNLVTWVNTTRYSAASVVNGDVFDDTQVTVFGNNFQGNTILVSINGMANTPADGVAMANAIAAFGNAPRASVTNGTHGLAFDAMQGFQNHIGEHTLADLRAATQIELAAIAIRRANPNGGGRIVVVAHSQGTEMFFHALDFLSADTKSMIDFYGVGGQRFVPRDIGLRSATNYYISNDGVPWFSNSLWSRALYASDHAYNVIRIQSGNGLAGHDFIGNYERLFNNANQGVIIPNQNLTRPVRYGGFRPLRDLFWNTN